MDDLQLFTPSKRLSHSKIRRFVRSIIEKWSEDIPKEMPIIYLFCNTWVMNPSDFSLQQNIPAVSRQAFILY